MISVERQGRVLQGHRGLWVVQESPEVGLMLWRRTGEGRRSRPSEEDESISLLYRLKLQYVALILIPAALLLYSAEERLLEWHAFPYRQVADTLFTTGIVVLAFEVFLRRETDARLSKVVRDTVEEELNPLVEHIARTIFSEPSQLLKALNESALHRVMSSALGIMLKDEALATEVNNGLLQAISKYDHRWTDARLSITLTRVQDHESPAIRSQYYEAYLSIRCRTILNVTEFPVWCVSSKEIFDDILWGNPDFFYAYLQPPTRAFPTVSDSSFRVERILVGGVPLETCIVKNLDDQRMLITCQGEALENSQEEPVIVEATFKIMVPKRTHSMNLTVPYPSRDVVMAFNYSDTEIRNVDVYDMFVSGQRPDIRRLPTVDRTQSIEVRLRDWAFPKGGVVFVWQLEQEATTVFTDLL
jgi:hypothetical protein